VPLVSNLFVSFYKGCLLVLEDRSSPRDRCCLLFFILLVLQSFFIHHLCSPLLLQVTLQAFHPLGRFKIVNLDKANSFAHFSVFIFYFLFFILYIYMVSLSFVMNDFTVVFVTPYLMYLFYF
jgi:hypothetical protein